MDFWNDNISLNQSHLQTRQWRIYKCFSSSNASGIVEGHTTVTTLQILQIIANVKNNYPAIFAFLNSNIAYDTAVHSTIEHVFLIAAELFILFQIPFHY